MKFLKGVLAVPLAALAFAGLARAEGIELYTFPAAPYQVVDNIPDPGASVRGLTVDTVLCAAAGAGGQARVHSAPQRRGIQFLLNNLIDGYFAVDPSTPLDRIAFRTNPVALEKWHLVSRPEPQPLETPRIGAVTGSNEEAWLRSRGIEVFLTVRTAQQLITLLQRNRIDQALMDQRVLESLSDTQGLTSQFLRYVPLHVYFSRSFVGRNPEFIDAFNGQIPSCIKTRFDLDDEEIARIRATAYELFRELEALTSLQAAIEDGPEVNSLSEILQLDAQWSSMAPLQHSETARRIADNRVSLTMKNWQRSRPLLVTEVMLTNSDATLVAMSRLTSDFWQGDEPEVENHTRENTGKLFVSPIRYDASTSRFQVTVSMPVIAKGHRLPVGVLIMGLDVEQALTAEEHIRYLTGAVKP